MPDHDELAKLTPPTIVTEPPVTDSVSSVESDATPTTAIAMELGSGDKSEEETGREGVELSPEPSPEVADDHISILSKYISEDQVRMCIHAYMYVCVVITLYIMYVLDKRVHIWLWYVYNQPRLSRHLCPRRPCYHTG